MINDYVIGKIYNYNGQVGSILTDKNEYKFNKKDVIGFIKNDDLVEFIPNTVLFGNEKELVAKFIKPYNQKKLIKNKV